MKSLNKLTLTTLLILTLMSCELPTQSNSSGDDNGKTKKKILSSKDASSEKSEEVTTKIIDKEFCLLNEDEELFDEISFKSDKTFKMTSFEGSGENTNEEMVIEGEWSVKGDLITLVVEDEAEEMLVSFKEQILIFTILLDNKTEDLEFIECKLQ